jgi:lipopolysaccharide biosynthesis regulator YciM
MSELTIDISETTHQTLLQLAQTSGEDLVTIMERAVENYRRSVFLDRADRAFAALRQNEELWQEEIAERQAWDLTIADGVSE